MKSDTQPKKHRPLCSLHEHCGGCTAQDQPYEEQLARKRGVLVKALAGLVEPDAVPAITGVTPPWGYRTRLLMPAVPRSKPHPGQPRFRFGFYGRGTTRLVEAPGCPVQHPLTLSAVAMVSQALADSPITATAPKSKGGWLHGLAVRVDPRSSAVELTLVGRTSKLPGGKALAAQLLSLPGISGVHISVNPSRSSFLMGPDFVHLAGRRRTVFHVGDQGFPLSPGSFFQTSARGAELLSERVIEALPDSMRCLADLYGGVGVFARLTERRWRRAVVAESNPYAVDDLRWWLRREKMDGCSVLLGRVEDVVGDALKQHPDAVVLDPPRAGCHPRVLDRLDYAKPPVLVYVSCNPEALTRDAQRLVKAGYQIDSVNGVDMFPHTEHLETIVRFVSS